MPAAPLTRDDELAGWARRLGLGAPRSRRGPPGGRPVSHPAIAVNLDACIQCTRCLRACRDEQVNDVIGLAQRGANAKIVFDIDDPMGAAPASAAASACRPARPAP
jgi:formate dehydrogenase major subunit